MSRGHADRPCGRITPVAAARGARRARGGRGAFSLVEVLVSVAVIAVLVSVLLPGLAGAREAGRTAVCGSGLRQVGAAVHVYAGDFRGAAPPAASRFVMNLDRWHGSRARVNDAFVPTGGALAAYLGEEERGAAGATAARTCPSFAGALEMLRASGRGYERSCGGYGYNAAFLGVVRARRAGSAAAWDVVTDRTGSMVSRFADAAGTVAMADSAMGDPGAGLGVIEYSFVEPRWWPDRPGVRPDPSMHFRHHARAGVSAGVAQAVFLDGHAAGLKRAMTYWSGIAGELTTDPLTGWAGEVGGTDDNGMFDYE